MSLTAGAMGCPLALRPTSRVAAKRRVSSKVRRAAPARASSFDPLDVAASKSTSAAREVLFPEIVGSTPREWIASASRLGADEADGDAKGAEVMRSGSTKSSMATAAGILALAGLAVAPDAFAASVATIADATEAVEATGGLLDGFLRRFANRTLGRRGGGIHRAHSLANVRPRGVRAALKQGALYGAGVFGCPAGTFSGSGATTCVRCAVGKYSAEDPASAT